MAGKSSKKQAQSNLETLKRLYLVVGPVLALSFLRLVFRHGSWIAFLALHAPIVGCVYMLEKSGRPQYDERGRVVREGMDLQQADLTEWMFDVVYLSVFADAGHVIFGSMKFWYVMLAVPVYVGYRVRSLAQPLLAGLGGSRQGRSTQEQDAGASGASKSKRQTKREKNADKVQFKYR